MFTPPIIGAGGFLMAEPPRMPYVEIIKLALFPALLYFFSVMIMVHFEAKRQNIFACQPPMLLYGTWVQILASFFFATVDTLAFSALTMGHLLRRTSIFEWLLLAATTFLCFYPERSFGLAGMLTVGDVFVWRKLKARRDSEYGQDA